MENKEMIVQELPAEMVEFGQKAAEQLIDIVKKNNWSVKIQGKDYLVFEAWQTVGKFFGYTVKTDKSNPIEINNITGFEATAVILDRNGLVIGGADAMCMTDEKKWASSPMYSLRSMAQTRAGAKALRMVLSWVVVLAGYKATPAEEMDGIEVVESPTTKTFEQPTTVSKPSTGNAMSYKQERAIKAICQDKFEWTGEETEYNLREYFDLEHEIHWNDAANKISMAQASQVISLLNSGGELK